MKTYYGICTPGEMNWAAVAVMDRVAKPLKPRNDLDNHSPDGFAWGYGGSGPAQLALALLADALGDDKRALRLHQDFKWHTVARWDKDKPWRITADEVIRIAKELEAECEGKSYAN